MNINGYELVQTCGACPEQYDVFLDGKQVGYLRLRHGYFSASVPGCMGEHVYGSGGMIGDGAFESEERMRFLTEAVRAIHHKLNSEAE